MEKGQIAGLEDLAKKLKAAKSKEGKAKEKRIEVEAEILDITGCKEDGATTHNAGKFKVICKGGLLYKADVKDIDALGIPENLAPVKTKREFDKAGYKWLKENQPEVYEKVTTVVAVSNAKPSVTIKIKD